MSSVEIDDTELVAAVYPNTHVVERLIASGAPVKWAGMRHLLRNATSEDVEFTGTVFRCYLANGRTRYSWNHPGRD